MDRMWVCGTYDPGSIPGESTIERAPSGAFSIVLSPAATVCVEQTGGRIEKVVEILNKISYNLNRIRRIRFLVRAHIQKDCFGSF